MKKWLMMILVGVLLTLGACGNDAEETATEPESEDIETEVEDVTEEVSEEGSAEVDVDAMEEILKESCISCHSGDYALSVGDTDLPVDEIQDLIINGIGNMPPTENITDEEAYELAKYLAKEP